MKSDWKRTSIALSILLAGGTCIIFSTAAARSPLKTEPHPPLKQFMRAKLDASNRILEGLATEDFALIARGSKQLAQMSAAEQWRVSNDALYRQHSAEFRRIVERLEKQAEEKKLEGAALTWIETTMSCIECHKYVRAQLIAGNGARPQ